MIETFLGLYLLAFSGFSASSSTDDTKLLKRTKRVVGGDLAQIDQFPYLVNIRRDGIFECGGSLITPSCVLTAAHCIKTGQPENFTVRAGVTYLSDKINSRRVRRIYKSPNYSNKTLDYDVAIFELQTPFQNPNVRTIDLPTEGSKLRIGESVRVAGWGLTSDRSTRPSNQVRTIDINVLAQSECRLQYKSYRNVTSRMFCASVPGIKDACSADSGGPAVSTNGKLVGIVSWGKGYECARVNSPGVYVNVAAVRTWIDGIMKRACH